MHVPGGFPPHSMSTVTRVRMVPVVLRKYAENKRNQTGHIPVLLSLCLSCVKLIRPFFIRT